MPTTTDPNATTPGGAPLGGALTQEATLRKVWDDVQARTGDQARLADEIRRVGEQAAAYYKVDPKHPNDPPSVNPADAPAYKATTDHLNDLMTRYQQEQASIGTQWGNVLKVIADDEQNAAQLGLDRDKLAADKAQAERMAGYYGAQANSAQADADAKQAQAAYDAATREAYPAADAAAHQRRVDEAKAALDESNGRLNNANAAAQEAANGVAPAVAQADLAVKQATAKYADQAAQAAADTAVAGAATAGSTAAITAATAAHAPEAAAATASSLTSQAAIDAANAAVAGDAATTAVKAAAARGDLDAAQANEILALLEGKQQYAQAQIEGQQAANEQTRLTTHQLQVGDVQTKIEQLGEAVKNGMHPAQADRLMEDYLSGSTPFQRQQQRETQLSGAMGQALSYGMGVLPGQQYLPGAEPGGAYDAAFSKLGVDLPNVQLSDARPLTSYVQAQGIQTAEQPAPQMFSATGGYTPLVAAAPTAVPAAPPPTAAGQPTHAAVPVVTTAQLLGQQPAQAAAEGGTFDPEQFFDPSLVGNFQVLEPFGPSIGGVTGSPYAIPGTVPVRPDDINAISRNAAGGTTVVPRAMQGMLQQPKVDRIPLFAARKAERRPMFAGRA